jgi:aminocarboxymuconate-semialdehyde decarboxylase
VVFTQSALRVLIEAHGIDRIVLGSDYPYPLGERPAGTVLRSYVTDEAERDALLSSNARSFLSLP